MSQYLSGNPENERELHGLFTEVFVLSIDKKILKHRVITRTNNQWGKLPHELAYSLHFRQKASEMHQKLGFTIIDATQPIKAIVDQLLLNLNL